MRRQRVRPEGTDKDAVVSVRVRQQLKDAIDRAADESGLGLMDWIRAVWARAANEGAFAPQGGKDAKSRNRTARKGRGTEG